MPQLQQTQQLFLCGFTVVAFMNAHSDGVQPRLAHYSSRHGGVGQPDAENFAAAEHRLFFIRNANHRGRHIAHQNHLSHHFRFIGKQLPTVLLSSTTTCARLLSCSSLKVLPSLKVMP